MIYFKVHKQFSLEENYELLPLKMEPVQQKSRKNINQKTDIMFGEASVINKM